MANTFELISAVTVGSGGSATIDFTSIPSTYTDLCLVMSARTSYSADNEQIRIQFNNDASTSNYQDRIIYAFGTTVGSASRTGNTGSQDFNANAANSTSSTFSNNQLYIPNYAGSNEKSFGYEVVDENNSSSGNWFIINAGIWKSTAAITSIKLSTIQGGSTFVQHSTAYLYGVSNT